MWFLSIKNNLTAVSGEQYQLIYYNPNLDEVKILYENVVKYGILDEYIWFLMLEENQLNLKFVVNRKMKGAKFANNIKIKVF